MQNGWRAAFIAAGVLISWGGSMHPGGTMEEMLADPQWLSGHMLVFAGFAAMTAALWALRARVPASLRRVVTIALIGAALQSLEMLVHAIANVDLEHLRMGMSTPVLTTHLVMTQVIYPVFAATTVGFIVATARAREVGSPWVAWIGVAGAVMHGLAGGLVPFLEVGWARALFPGVVLLALWMIVAGLWRTPLASRAAASV